jgi:hypothetical protein
MKIYFHNQYKSAALKSKPRPEEKHFTAEAQDVRKNPQQLSVSIYIGG